ncbi:hypothetical protein ACFSTH_05635 [Paenibacillus yanchengensis]|uniref:Group-specific protein n=1 Tax=Paenibacillus yanchengensis TaxID=2035833 RepID=A0ABW4YHG7_9BACL
MHMILGWFITLGLIFNVVFMIREGKDERGRKILFFPLLYSFCLLFLGYSVLNLVVKYWTLEIAIYQLYLDYIFAGSLLVYLLLLFFEKRKKA